jgi:hypothetical protein
MKVSDLKLGTIPSNWVHPQYVPWLKKPGLSRKFIASCRNRSPISFLAGSSLLVLTQSEVRGHSQWSALPLPHSSTGPTGCPVTAVYISPAKQQATQAYTSCLPSSHSGPCTYWARSQHKQQTMPLDHLQHNKVHFNSRTQWCKPYITHAGWKLVPL